MGQRRIVPGANPILVDEGAVTAAHVKKRCSIVISASGGDGGAARRSYLLKIVRVAG